MRRLLAIAVLVAACGGSTVTPSKDGGGSPSASSAAAVSGSSIQSTAPSPLPTSVKGRFDIGGRSLFLECVGAGSPTVVMETGQGGAHTQWYKVAPAIRGTNRTCTYDRANIGASDRAPTPRTSADVVADLHRLLAVAGIAPPYVLVGQSLGGISMRLYASTYPQEIVALVLVDPTPTTILADACATLDTAGCQAIRSEFTPSPDDGVDIVGSAAELKAAGPLPAVPFVVLAADDHGLTAVDATARARFEASWKAREQELATSVASGRLEVVSSGHNIQTLHPEAVIEAIREVLARLPAPS